ncbi:Clavaminate synthase-like protein, partial [Karstenula rhodostoma CBS 690.94]
EPTVFPRQFLDLPAINNWFTPVDCPAGDGVCHELKTSYLGRHGSLIVPLEYTRYRPDGDDVDSRKAIAAFECIQAPLSLLLSHISSNDYSQQLYLAQCSLDDLPPDLQADLPAPDFISTLGRGDIYASSIWMGRPPTSTPLHRDPNPNLFVQLVGRKVIRLMKPKQGRHLYDRLRTQMGHAHMRGEEMMVGEERNKLQDSVWNEKDVMGVSASGVEARLEGGDGLYIPLGWWHAVESVGSHTNASVNWWFR